MLVTGEAGTGKQLIARAVHERSRREGKRFVAIDCASFSVCLPDSLLEAAHGGTLLLDDVGDMSPAVQDELLRHPARGHRRRQGDRGDAPRPRRDDRRRPVPEGSLPSVERRQHRRAAAARAARGSPPAHPVFLEQVPSTRHPAGADVIGRLERPVCVWFSGECPPARTRDRARHRPGGQAARSTCVTSRRRSGRRWPRSRSRLPCRRRWRSPGRCRLRSRRPSRGSSA